MIDRPKATIFPGATNPDITTATINDTICRSGWSTTSIRPPTSYTNALKKAQVHTLGHDVANALPRVPTKSGKTTRPDLTPCVERSSNPACYEADHLISLDWRQPTQPRQPLAAAVVRRLECARQRHNRLHRPVCEGDITLEEAQHAIATDWIAAYQKYVGPTPRPRAGRK